MVVLMPNTTLGLRRRVDVAETRNAHGERIPAGWGEVVGMHDGRTKEGSDATWRLGLDMDLWPIREGDLVISADGSTWLVRTADPIRNHMDSTVDWVRVTALLRTGGGTVPGGGWFVARYEDTVSTEAPDPTDGPAQREDGVWVGYGPAPADWASAGMAVGDQYVDLNTGIVYEVGGT